MYVYLHYIIKGAGVVNAMPKDITAIACSFAKAIPVRRIAN